MVAYVVTLIYVLAAFLALMKPRTALMWFWPLVLCYPTWLLYNILPLNAGLDDIYLVCLFLGSVFKGRPKVGLPVIFAIVFCALAVLGDISTMWLIGGLDSQMILKRFLKSTGLIFLLFTVCTTITTPKQIKAAVYSLVIGAVAGAALVIYYTLNPTKENPFQFPEWFTQLTKRGYQPLGPFSTHDTAGGVLGFTILLGYFLIRFTKSIFEKVVLIAITAVSFIGSLACGSRSGWLFVAFPIMMSSLLSKQKIMGFVLLGLVILAIVFSLTLFQDFADRWEHTRDQAGGGAQGVTSGRFLIWIDTLSNYNIRWLFFGEGFTVEEYHVHSNYLGILKNMGCAGIVFWFIYYLKLAKRTIWLKKHDPNPAMATLLTSIFWVYVGYFAYFTTCTAVMMAPVRYVDFFLMGLVHLRYRLVEEEMQYAYQEQLYEDMLVYDEFLATDSGVLS